jgi:hypothetical protein
MFYNYLFPGKNFKNILEFELYSVNTYQQKAKVNLTVYLTLTHARILITLTCK